MCGRFVLEEPKLISRRFGVKNKLPLFEPNYNIAPGTRALVIIKNSPNKCELMNWGFLADWSKDPKYTVINARDDKLEGNFYKSAFLHKRCLIPVSGFYEWRKVGEKKLPYYIGLKDQSLFGFGGIYSEHGFAIITTKPNQVMAKIHDRMPLIIEKENEDIWLNSESEMDKVKKLIRLIESNRMKGWRVSKEVNDVRNNDKELIEKIS